MVRHGNHSDDVPNGPRRLSRNDKIAVFTQPRTVRWQASSYEPLMRAGWSSSWI